MSVSAQYFDLKLSACVVPRFDVGNENIGSVDRNAGPA